MKTKFIPFMAGMALYCVCTSVKAQEYKEHLHKEFAFQKDASAITVAIYNINGSVKVEGYSGDKVMLEIDETISAKTDAMLETGKKEFKLEFKQMGDTIIAYIAEPIDSRPNRNWNRNRDGWHVGYHYNLEFSVKVPFNVNLDVSTVNGGNVNVQDVAGILNVHNVNGSITVANAKSATNARTVNGNVVVNYVSNPTDESSYNTINGDIRINYQKDLSADMQFKSMHGDFYTDFADASAMPIQAIKNVEKIANGTVYKLNKTTTFRFGAGGKIFRFETLNGNVYIKRQS